MKHLTPIVLFLLVQFYGAFAQKTLLTNANVINIHEGTIAVNSQVLIADGKIVGIGKNLRAGKGVKVIDCKSGYLIPGLFDMHTHFQYEQGDHVDYSPAELKLMLANGLTTARITNGDSLYLVARKMVREGKWVGPDLIVTSPQLVGSWPWMGRMFAGVCKTPSQGDSLVRLYKKQGYDEIKLTVNIKPDVYKAIQKAAKDVGIKVVGHVGPFVKLPLALEYHQQVEHMDQFIEMLLPDTTINHGQSVSDMNLWNRKAWETIPHLDTARIPMLVQEVKASGIYVTPTNYFFHSFFGEGVDGEAEKSKASYQYIPATLKDNAWKVREHYATRMADEKSRQRYIAIRKQMIFQLWKAGVPLMAGSDSPQWFGVAGFAIHDELANLVQCGLTPLAALQTATINPARYLNLQNKGSLVVGNDADLLLLENNPLEDIGNTTKIRGVMKEGHWYDQQQVKKLLEEAKLGLNAR